MTQCATCGEADVLLFTCSHCDGEFCPDHLFPHHACDGVGGAGTEGDTDAAPGSAADRAAESDGDVEAGSTAAEPSIEPIARDAARERRPDRQGPTPPPPGRGLPGDRYDDRTVVDWIREQSYPGYVAKVGSLSLLFTLSYYGGLVAVL